MTTSKARARNKRGEGALLRDDIVDGATRLLDGGTEQSVTLRAVAREVGISAPAIYQHFPDRDSILLAVAQLAFAELGHELRAVGDHADPAENLRAVCTAYLVFAQQRPNRYRILFGGVWDASKALERAPALTDDLTALGMETFHVLRQAVAACVEKGRSTSSDPQADAAALWVALHGFAQLQVAAPLFPWPPDLQSSLITRLALLRD
ncbi:TetR/AcrR family transcriptional regulator [Amycolatopsis sp. H20-H5]|uniref:TetR/AcrR family transcriptional regulator n=1 Tax=Amycolatopsis sp. H20-H5 TaxID=3046309 RepID=UPI002DBE4F09|nr:TetR/AcrR family transcriptional regulator [Amycolatopsis sp. H20-H5]MEC3976578.1 TetR/AcrR family transcriptional regulator [Amycolatopsis sp. H20-H5]